MACRRGGFSNSRFASAKSFRASPRAPPRTSILPHRDSARSPRCKPLSSAPTSILSRSTPGRFGASVQCRRAFRPSGAQSVMRSRRKESSGGESRASTTGVSRAPGCRRNRNGRYRGGRHPRQLPALGRLLHGKADLKVLKRGHNRAAGPSRPAPWYTDCGPIAVERDAARLGRKRNQRSRRGLHWGKTAQCRTRPSS